jgi:hypothetical protein
LVKILKTFLKKIFFIFFLTIILLLVLDFFLGNFILKNLDNYFNKTQFYERLFRIDHKIYHHDLKPNTFYKLSKSFNGGYFNFCTDNNGFRSKCLVENDKNFDIGFMGDSFVEGISLDYEDSFVGIFEKQVNKKVANLGTVSYSTSIYLSKINYLLNNEYHFKEIILFIDVSDLYDDSVYYLLDENLLIKENYSITKKNRFRRFLRMNFKLINYFFYVLNKKKDLNQNLDNNDFILGSYGNLKSSWTYSKEDVIEDFTYSINDAKKKQMENIDKLYKLLKEKNIELSIAVYPWPQTLQFDNEKSTYVKMWQEFCNNKCKNFINYFPIFFKEIKKSNFMDVYKKYYWWNDVHFNKEGNRLIANELIKYYKQ